MVPNREKSLPHRYGWECMPGPAWEKLPDRSNYELNFLFEISEDVVVMVVVGTRVEIESYFKKMHQIGYSTPPFYPSHILFLDILRTAGSDHPLCKQVLSTAGLPCDYVSNLGGRGRYGSAENQTLD